MWRKPVPSRRVTLTAELTLASVYFTRKQLIPLLEPEGKAHAPVVQNSDRACSDYLDWIDPAGPARAFIWRNVGRASRVWSPLEFRLRLSGCLSRWLVRSCLLVSCWKEERSREEELGMGEREEGFCPFCFPPYYHPSRSLLSRFSRSSRVDCEQSLFFLRFSEAIFVSRAFRSTD